MVKIKGSDMLERLSDIPPEDLNEYVCKVDVVTHSHKALVVSMRHPYKQLPVKSLDFMIPYYFEGPMEWTGADFTELSLQDGFAYWKQLYPHLSDEAYKSTKKMFERDYMKVCVVQTRGKPVHIIYCGLSGGDSHPQQAYRITPRRVNNSETHLIQTKKLHDLEELECIASQEDLKEYHCSLNAISFSDKTTFVYIRHPDRKFSSKTLHFVDVKYFEGGMGWMGANFTEVSHQDSIEFWKQVEPTLSDEELDRFFRQYKMCEIQSQSKPIRIVYGSLSVTDGAFYYSVEPYIAD